LGLLALREIAGGDGARLAAGDLETRLDGLRDGAAAAGQWRRARAALGAFAATVAEAEGGAVGAAAAASAAAAQLLPPALLLQELAHDRLHTGHWSAAPGAWRDAHAAATLCAVAARLALTGDDGDGDSDERGDNGGGGGGARDLPPSWSSCPALSGFLGGAQDDARAPPAPPPPPPAAARGRLAAAAALRALDLALILGAPGAGGWWRRALDASAERVDAALAALEAAEEEEEGGDGGDRGGRGGGGKRRRLGRAAARPPSLPPRSLSAASRARLPRCAAPPPLDAFLSRHLAPAAPLLISAGLMDAWPAASRWREDRYLARVCGRRTVPVEVGRHFLDPALATPLLRVSELLRRINEQEDEEEGEGGREEDHNRQGGRGPAAYLAQHPLLDQLPRLRRDVLVPDYCALAAAPPGRGEGGGEDGGDEDGGDNENDDEDGDEVGGGASPRPRPPPSPPPPPAVAINAWLGGPGTVTPLHHDGARHNLLCVVAGRKYVRLYPPGATTERALRPLPPPHGNASGLAPLLDTPEAAAALASLDAGAMADVMLGPGQALYVPPGWWHYVSSWAEEEATKEAGDGGQGAAAAGTARQQPPPPAYCFAISFWF